MAKQNTSGPDLASDTTATAELPLNNELIDLAGQLEDANSGMLPESKAEVAAQNAAVDAKKAAIESGAAMVRKGLTMLAGAACAKYPALVPVWTEPVIDRISRAAAAVLLKYGVESGPFMAKYAEEIELLMAAGEPLLVSYFIIKKAKEEEAKAAGGIPTGQGNGTIEPTADSAPRSDTIQLS